MVAEAVATARDQRDRGASAPCALESCEGTRH